MEKNTKISLAIAATGLAARMYEDYNQKHNQLPYLAQRDSNIKLLGGIAVVGGVVSAGIFEIFKDNPVARRNSFIAAGAIVGVGLYGLIVAIKNFT